MTKLLKIAGVTAGKKASGIKVDEFGRIELSRTVEPKRIIGNVLEPYSEDYKGPVSVFGLELYAINSAIVSPYHNRAQKSQPTPDGWLLQLPRGLVRYDSKGTVIWEAGEREGPRYNEYIPAVVGDGVYTVTRLVGENLFSVDKLSYKTGEVVKEGAILDGITRGTQLVYAANIDRLIGVVQAGADNNELIYVNPETLGYERSGASFQTKLESIFGAGKLGGVTVISERDVMYVLAGDKGIASAKINANMEVTIQSLTKTFDFSINNGDGVVLNGDVYSEGYGQAKSQIMRNGKIIYTRETPKTNHFFIGGTTGNLALMADGNKVLAFDKDNLVMSVEIPHDIEIRNIAGDSMGNIFVGTSGGIYILGDTLQIKGYQLVG